MPIDRGGSKAHALQLAIEFHQNGHWSQAEAIYQDIVRSHPKDIDATYRLGLLYAQQGKFESAAKFLGKAAHLKPDLLDAHYNCGVMLNALGRHAAALASYDKVLRLKPDHAGALQNRAGSLFELRRFAEALGGYDKVIETSGEHAETLDNRGVVLRELRRFEEALESHDRALAIAPDHAPALNNRGAALRALDRHEEALACYDRVILRNPNYAETYYNRAIALIELKRFDEALRDCDSAIALTPLHVDAHQNRGVALLELGRLDEALQGFGQVIALRPNHAEAFSNRGLALRGLKRVAEALQQFDHAVALKPDYAGAYNNRGLALNDLQCFEAALRSFDRATAINPDYAEAWYNRGIALNELKRFEEAIKSYDRVIAINPDHEFVEGTRLNTKMRICDWTDLDKNISVLCDKVAAGKKATHPFPFLAASSSPALQRKAAEIWQEHEFPANFRLPPISSHRRRDKIRLGYFSADFHAHAVAYQLAGPLEQHDRSKFELIAFSFDIDKADDMRERLRSCFDEFIDVTGVSDEEIVRLARERQIDIAVDLQGVTRGNRTNVFAMRAAPLQVNFLGYPGTMGADYIDYLVVDSTLMPPSQRSYYREKLIYLPNTFLPTDSRRVIAERIPTRAEAGLPEEGFVFCCFNNNHKILPEIFDIWMKLLKQIDGAVLWLFKDNASAAANLRKEASTRGVDPDRLIFATYVAQPTDHWARLCCADLFLDTLPYNAHATASDALWAGLPVLTRIGETFAGRVAASLLGAVGLPELVTTTAQEYESVALSLARDPDTLAQIKRKLANNRLTRPLFDTVLFTRHIEAAYAAIYDRYHAGLPPDHIHVQPE